MIYFDNAATTLQKPTEVINAVATAMASMGNASRGTYNNALQASRGIYEARCKLAALFNCRRADHVVFTCNSTESLNIAIYGTLNPGDHVITTDLEHNSVLRPLYRMQEEKSVSLSFVRADCNGQIRIDDFTDLIRPETKAIICTHASNVTGEMVDIAKVGALAHERRLKFIVDASQTAGSVTIDMEKMGIDILCFTGHKGMMGPQGTGGMCIREGIEIRPFKTGGTGVQTYLKGQPEEYPTRLEAGTLNSHGIIGLSAAVDFLKHTGVEWIGAWEHSLMQRFYDGVSCVPGITVYGNFSQGHPRTAIVALNILDYDSGRVADELSQYYDIAVRPGAHCAPRMHEALGTSGQGAVRFSFSWFNTEEEVDAAITAIEKIATN